MPCVELSGLPQCIPTHLQMPCFHQRMPVSAASGWQPSPTQCQSYYQGH